MLPLLQLVCGNLVQVKYFSSDSVMLCMY
uniref:Uncharacterized protein n=1 Tax=Arundo donax TaxID=35708 RepID=A0A0A9GE85_ARUDO